MYLAQKIELKLNKNQIKDFENYFGYSRYCYNKALSTWKEMFNLHKVNSSNPKPTHRKVRDELKRTKEDWEENLPKMILETACEDLGKAFNMMWKTKSKYPKFKKKNKCKKSCRFFKKNNYSLQVLDNKKLKLQGLTYTIKMKESLNISGDIKEVTISNVNNKYYASFIVNCDDKLFSIDNELYCGIDLGIKDLAIVNGDDGLYRKYKSLISKLKPLYNKVTYYNKVLSRKIPNSNEYNLTKAKLNKVYLRIKNIKNDYLHKITTNIISRYRYICIEDLKVSNMIKNKHLSKSIGESCWYTFKEMLKYKAKMYGNKIIIADRFFPSSQLCSCCGHIFTGDKKLKLHQRVYKGPDCGNIIDRDFNASINLKEYGRRNMGLANEGY